MNDANHWFATASQHPQPRPWQERLLSDSVCRSRLIRVPTGQGKTLGTLGAWAWHRCVRGDKAWPRRLVWCLPMRVLTEQTVAEAEQFLQHAGLTDRVKVHTLMGGADAEEWYLHPEREAVLVGTQDMLLSRALNRGYASPRGRWPTEFGLLSQDALWVYDEIQLMDVGLATSAQLQAYRDQDSDKQLLPTHAWWMSATLQEQWLHSVDTQDHHPAWTAEPITVQAAERNEGPAAVRKALEAPQAIDHKDCKAFAELILGQHQSGTITLVVCNTVQRACETYAALGKQGRDTELKLVHSRFRPAERAEWREAFLNRGACGEGVDRIIVATQVVEAGVDISAATLVTELAPWPSLVQRFGRCARYGGSGKVLVVDRGQDDKTAAPYTPAVLTAAWKTLENLDDVGIASLEAYEDSLDTAARSALYPYDPPHLLLRREYDELFDTTPDLTGADLDIGRFIRSGDERDCLVFWADIAPKERPPTTRRAQREELCPVPFLAARDWLCDKGSERLSGGKTPMRAWIWDWIDGRWNDAGRSALLPGRIVCVAASCGGYQPAMGFDPKTRSTVPEVTLTPLPVEQAIQEQADDSQDGEDLSIAAWKTIACHGGEVAKEAETITAELELPQELRELLTLAGLWHDLGKAHPAFQSLIESKDRPPRKDLAKAPNPAWRRHYQCTDGERKGFRHELASALALFAVLQRHRPDHPALLGPWVEVLPALGKAMPEACADAPPSPIEQAILDLDAPLFDLLTYLVAAHHGKVRVALHAAPADQDFRAHRDDKRGLPIRGVREADTLPATVLDPSAPSLPELSLTLSPAALGLSATTGRSWRERTLDLQARFGPAALALLEAIIIAADRRASRLTTSDPMLLEEARQ
ncbi:MAG: CRISPR-associated helicase Cas3' [Planctomycetota bacterium]|nr:MAG: CRISPR-associated helicase Cas3' [Planctomycetota bacterium]